MFENRYNKPFKVRIVCASPNNFDDVLYNLVKDAELQEYMLHSIVPFDIRKNEFGLSVIRFYMIFTKKD